MLWRAGRSSLRSAARAGRPLSFRNTSQAHSRDLAVLPLAVKRVGPWLAQQEGADGLLRVPSQQFGGHRLCLIDLARQCQSRREHTIRVAKIGIDLNAAPSP